MQNDKEIDAAMRVAARIVEIQRDHCEELKTLGQDDMNAIFNAHLPLFSVINMSRTLIKESFDPDALEHFDGLIDMLKIDRGAH